MGHLAGLTQEQHRPHDLVRSSHLHQRKNRRAGAAMLVAIEAREGPPLPDLDREWHPLTIARGARVGLADLRARVIALTVDGSGPDGGRS